MMNNISVVFTGQRPLRREQQVEPQILSIRQRLTEVPVHRFVRAGPRSRRVRLLVSARPWVLVRSHPRLHAPPTRATCCQPRVQFPIQPRASPAS